MHRKKGYAVPAFNYYNLDVLFAVLGSSRGGGCTCDCTAVQCIRSIPAP